MKKIDTLIKAALLPSKQTINNILAFSKNVAVVKNKRKIYVISKN